MAEFDWFQRQDSSESSDAQQPDDALDWAKQAYARLKAQQEAEKSAAAAPPAEPAQAPMKLDKKNSRTIKLGHRL